MRRIVYGPVVKRRAAQAATLIVGCGSDGHDVSGHARGFAGFRAVRRRKRLLAVLRSTLPRRVPVLAELASRTVLRASRLEGAQFVQAFPSRDSWGAAEQLRSRRQPNNATNEARRPLPFPPCQASALHR